MNVFFLRNDCRMSKKWGKNGDKSRNNMTNMLETRTLQNWEKMTENRTQNGKNVGKSNGNNDKNVGKSEFKKKERAKLIQTQATA